MTKLRFISLDELLEKMANREKMMLVEVLDEDYYRQGHLPGAINLAVDSLPQSAEQQLKKTETIIVYCASYHCQASTKAAEILLKAGYKNTLDFKGGKKAWEQAGLELER
jgi:rhodanese-related sulfurtransferase